MPDYGHDLLFGAFITPSASDPRVPVQLAQAADRAGLDLVTFQDHPYQPAFLDTLTLISWVAAVTQTVAIAANVHNLPLRPPAVLARSLASLDRLSGGRIALGLGAGSFWDAVVAMGGPRRTPGEAFDALDEALDVVHGIWDTKDRSVLRIDGDHYHLDGAKRGPAPAHDIPVWIGALGPRMLRLIGRRADGWLPSMSYLKPGGLAQGNAMIDGAAAKAGRDPRRIRRMLNIFGGTGAPAPFSRPVAQDPAGWAAELTRLALEEGVSAFIVGGDDERGIQVLADDVAPTVREQVARERS